MKWIVTENFKEENDLQLKSILYCPFETIPKDMEGQRQSEANRKILELPRLEMLVMCPE